MFFGHLSTVKAAADWTTEAICQKSIGIMSLKEIFSLPLYGYIYLFLFFTAVTDSKLGQNICYGELLTINKQTMLCKLLCLHPFV